MNRDTSRFFETVLVDLPVGVQVWQMKPAFGPERCRLVFVNTSAAALLARPVESTLGRTLEDLFPEFCEQGLPSCLARVLDERTTVCFGTLEYGGAKLLTHVFRLPTLRVGVTLQLMPEAEPGAVSS
jgi:hypothetical protein